MLSEFNKINSTKYLILFFLARSIKRAFLFRKGYTNTNTNWNEICENATGNGTGNPHSLLIRFENL